MPNLDIFDNATGRPMQRSPSVAGSAHACYKCGMPIYRTLCLHISSFLALVLHNIAIPKDGDFTSIVPVMDASRPQIIHSTVEYLRHLHDLAASDAELKKGGYILQQLTESELERKMRCSRCKRGKQYTRHSVSRLHNVQAS